MARSLRYRPPPRRRHTRGTGAEIPALLALLVWVGGFELAPFLHGLDHDADHARGAVAHCHGHACHGHVDEGAQADDEPAPQRDGDEGQLLHRGLAAHTPPPAIPPFSAPWSATVCTRDEAPTPADRLHRERPRARAPPSGPIP